MYRATVWTEIVTVAVWLVLERVRCFPRQRIGSELDGIGPPVVPVFRTKNNQFFPATCGTAIAGDGDGGGDHFLFSHSIPLTN